MAETKVTGLIANALEDLRTIVDANTIIGTPIETNSGTTIIPVSKVSVGFGGGGSDFVNTKQSANADMPFGGGAGGGVKVTPICFLIVQGGNVRMMPVPVAANTTADRLVEMVPDTLDKITAFIDSRTAK